jgi:hypothetical protein
MGLTWTGESGSYIRRGTDANGRFYGHVSRLAGPWHANLPPWACGREGGLSIGPFDSEEAAMEAVDRHVVAYIDGC